MTKGKGAAAMTRQDLIRENERLKEKLAQRRTSQLISGLTDLGKWAIAGVCAVFCVYFLAGQVTLVGAKVDLGSSIGDALKEIASNLWIDLLLLAGLVTSSRAAARYRKINRSLVQQVSSKTRLLEQLKDPNRSSSKLGKDGETHEGDK